MNFLAHFWLADRAGADLAGALLGDYWRGALPPAMPASLAHSVRLHRRLDALTDRHVVVHKARADFAPGARRYAGILLDLLFDHRLARDWARYSDEPLPLFAGRAAQAVAAEALWFERAGGPVPAAAPFAELLRSYATLNGLDEAIARTARRLRYPEGLLAAAQDWQRRESELTADLPRLLDDLMQAARQF